MFLFYNFSIFYFFCFVLFFSLLCFVCILVAVAYFTLLDRKVMAAMQRRRGPNIVGVLGLLQPLADGLKLLVKEGIVPLQANSFLFMFAPILTFMISMVSWSFIPFSDYGSLVDVETGILFILAVSSFGVYGMILSGWSSNSKYAFLGAVRSTAQMISYEVSIGFMLISVLICSGTPNLYGLVQHQEQLAFWHCWFMWPQFFLLLFSAVAETNRAPFLRHFYNHLILFFMKVNLCT